jgi:carboxyl-terminal processing protease
MKNTRRLTWIFLSVIFTVIIGLFILVPSVFAQSDDAEINRYMSLFERVFRFVHDNYVDEVDPETLFHGAMDGLFESLDDPHSSYLVPNEMQDLTDTTSGQFGGVGLYITKSSQRIGVEGEVPEDYSPYVRVVAPIEETPAARAGIHAGDFIIAIEGETTKDLDIDTVVDRLRGIPGSTVTVTILRNKDIEFDVTIERAVIETPTTRHAMIPGGIGYLRIIQFTPLTTEKVKEAIEEFEENNYRGLIIDVRNNPGGLLSSVVDVADIFLPGGVVVSTKSRIPSENEVYTADQDIDVPLNKPIVLLIDQGSASASEILAGAFKDRERALLLGEQTFGKGSVQQVKYVGEGGFKLTMSRYYTPAGINIDQIGIEPDRVIKEPEFTDEEQESYRRILKNRWIEDFVDGRKSISTREINTFIDELQEERGIILKDRILGRLIRNEINRRIDSPPVYDLKYDIVLQEAVELLREGKVAGGKR